MKNLLVILISLVLVAPVSFAKDSLGISLKDELGLAVDWNSTNPEMAVYTIDADYNYLPLQKNRGNDGWIGQTLVFEHIYENIDLILKPMENGKTAYEFVVYPGGDLSEVKLLKGAFVENNTFMASELKATQDNAGASDRNIEVKMLRKTEGLGLEVGTYEVAQALTVTFVL